MSEYEGFQKLADDFNAYLNMVKQTCLETFEASKGQEHELAAKTASNMADAFYKRWAEAYQTVSGGGTYDFPTAVSVKKIDDSK